MDRDTIRERVRTSYYKNNFDSNEAVTKFQEDVLAYLKECYGVTKNYALVLYRYGWDEGHSSGLPEVFGIIEDIVTILEEMKFMKELGPTSEGEFKKRFQEIANHIPLGILDELHKRKHHSVNIPGAFNTITERAGREFRDATSLRDYLILVKRWFGDKK